MFVLSEVVVFFVNCLVVLVWFFVCLVLLVVCIMFVWFVMISMVRSKVYWKCFNLLFFFGYDIEGISLRIVLIMMVKIGIVIMRIKIFLVNFIFEVMVFWLVFFVSCVLNLVI